MVLASVKLSMPGGDPAKKRKRRGASSGPGTSNKYLALGPRTRMRRTAPTSPARGTQAGAAKRRTLEEEFLRLSRGGAGLVQAPRPSPLRIKLSVKRVVVDAAPAAVAKPPGGVRKYKNVTISYTGKSGFGRAGRPASQFSSASDPVVATDGSPRDYRSLIEEHRNKESSKEGSAAASGFWVCRHCGARRKEGKRGAALSNLLSHLRSCVKSDVVEEYLNHAKPASKKNPPAEAPPVVATKRGATPATTSLNDACGSMMPPPPPRIQPAKSDVCLGDGFNRGYRLLQDAVKGVRMSVDEENWEYTAVSQTLEGLRRVHRHPNRRFLVRAAGSGGWVEASSDVVRKKILALYRRYFRFKPTSKVAADPFPALMNYDPAAPFGFDDDPFAVFHETEPHPSGTNLDAGIIRHVLIEEDVSMPMPDDETSPRSTPNGHVSLSSAESSAVFSAQDAPEEPVQTRARRSSAAPSPSFQHVTAAGSRNDDDDDDQREIERSWESSVYREVQSKISAKWYTLEQEREQRAVLLELQMGELRAAQATYAERKALVDSARAQYMELAASAGVNVEEGWAASTRSAVEESATLHTTSASADGQDEDGLAGRIRKRLGILKAETTELGGELVLWTERTADLEKFIRALDRPTEDYLRANARLAELEAQAEGLLKDELAYR